MSLALANAWGFITLHKRILLYCVGGLALLALILFGADRCSTYFAQRKIDKLKSNVNKILANVVNAETTIANLRERQASELEAANQQVQEFHNEVNASIEARKESDKALEAVNAARNSNNVNVSADELEKKLDKLDQ